ncbi:hypothetical protein G7084_03855 [Weissella coleopterorum]|uniref:Uncharacterized protein n=1 Tax=Weissella coleopterorum TaxID=2714949 RepID=A0A6G8B069_9LACO|nr:hypothetical protein [Weissella coleopterorum]QIL50523.1 hypothetical protein G7084_03855 [Weissella coleopterorum]
MLDRKITVSLRGVLSIVVAILILILFLISLPYLKSKYSSISEVCFILIKQIFTILVTIFIGYVGASVKLWIDQKNLKIQSKRLTIKNLKLIKIELESNLSTLELFNRDEISNYDMLKIKYDDSFTKKLFFSIECRDSLSKSIIELLGKGRVFLSGSDDQIKIALPKMIKNFKKNISFIDDEITYLNEYNN